MSVSKKEALSENAIKKKLRPVQSECVKVVIRVRPLIHKKELEDRRLCIVNDLSINQITITSPEDKQRVQNFSFDGIFPIGCTQKDVYDNTAKFVVESVLEGYNGTVIAYGQTGAGKTFTMEGNNEHPGLIPQCFEHIFDYVKKESKDRKFLVQCSMLQIYKEETFDLLGKNPKKKLPLRENAKTKEFYVQNLTKYMVNSAQQITKIMKKGQGSRTVHATPMNPGSSRSHSIFQVKIETIERYPDGKEHVRSGKLQLVDLAGSERAKKTGGVRQEEMIKINWGLTCLGNVIMSLTTKNKGHIPYRDSKLTKLLQDSLGGNTKTVLVANVSPSWYNYSETLNTLRYASRAKKIANRPVINEDPKDALIRQFQEQIKKLKEQMGMNGPSQNGSVPGGAGGGARVMDEKLLEEMKKKMEEEKQKLVVEMSSRTEKEKETLLKRQQDLEVKKKEIEKKLHDRHRELQIHKKRQEAMKQKLQRMQSLVVEGGSLKQQNRAMKEELMKQKEALLLREAEEQKLARELRKKREMEEMMRDKLHSTKKEVNIQMKKLKTLWQNLKAAKAENQDLISSFQHEREEYLFAIRNLEREMKLKDLIINNFIPPDEVQRIERRAVWDGEVEDFVLRQAHLAGNHIVKRASAMMGYDQRPVSMFAQKQRKVSRNPRYKIRDVLDFEGNDGNSDLFDEGESGSDMDEEEENVGSY